MLSSFVFIRINYDLLGPPLLQSIDISKTYTASLSEFWNKNTFAYTIRKSRQIVKLSIKSSENPKHAKIRSILKQKTVTKEYNKNNMMNLVPFMILDRTVRCCLSKIYKDVEITALLHVSGHDGRGNNIAFCDLPISVLGKAHLSHIFVGEWFVLNLTC